MTRRRTVRVAFIATAVAVAACSDNGSTPTEAPAALPNASSVSSDGSAAADNPHKNVHAIKPTQLEAYRNAGKPGGGGTGILYHGGPVLQSGTNVAAIYWAASTIYPGGPTPGATGSGAQDGSLIGLFMRGLGGTPYYNINSTYTDGAGRAIVNSVTYTQFYANNTSVPANGASVSDAQIVSMLQAAFNTGKLSFDASTLYNVFTAGTVNLGGGFGTQYCAYHTHGTVTIGGVARTVLYSAMPYDDAYPSACSAQLGSANNDPGADAEVNTLAHEIEETTTDMMGNAWFDRRGYENADKCAWTWGTTYAAANGATVNMKVGGKDFLVQQNWINSGSGGCRLSA